MRMKPKDVMGSLYSSAGLRFGGFSTLEFLSVTEDVEQERFGIREEIIAEAHYLAIWPHRFPEITFLFAIIAWRSILMAIISLVAAQVIETFRFYFFGPSTIISHTCKFWQFVKFPLYLVTAILIWPTNYVISLLLIVFMILQCWLGLITNVLTMPYNYVSVETRRTLPRFPGSTCTAVRY